MALDAMVMMVIGVIVIWGGFFASVFYAMMKARGKSKS
ncbi:MetS family NSS transporter small subunit [Fervidibacillus halotolerans]|uniref:MetS family NSS transporter small subunit n=1 Tax=Fervidibacillus halotolerans TaxID=2980027 RepID=A0A9E8RY63_9BACI|nr:MetS family NSS transporter small subunit [Fervidibacillus halotolerans]WAA11898.1 MetS family NSS transporter small subunit [Fervidibacillus halotolerans]